MKQIIEVRVQTRKVELARCKTDLLVLGRCSDAEPDDMVQALDRALGGRIEQLAKLGDFKGKPKTSVLLYGEGKLAAERVLLVGLGERKKATLFF